MRIVEDGTWALFLSALAEHSLCYSGPVFARTERSIWESQTSQPIDDAPPHTIGMVLVEIRWFALEREAADNPCRTRGVFLLLVKVIV